MEGWAWELRNVVSPRGNYQTTYSTASIPAQARGGARFLAALAERYARTMGRGGDRRSQTPASASRDLMLLGSEWVGEGVDTHEGRNLDEALKLGRHT